MHETRNKVDGLWYIPLPHNIHPPYAQQPLDTTKTAVSYTSYAIYPNIPTCEYMTKNVHDNGANALPSTPKHHHANSTIRCARYKNELANFYHAVTFSQVPSTFVRAIHRGHFSSWPGLTISLINKHLTKSIATSTGHLRMQFQNLHSTKTKYEANTSALDIAPIQEPSNLRTHNAFLALSPDPTPIKLAVYPLHPAAEINTSSSSTIMTPTPSSQQLFQIDKAVQYVRHGPKHTNNCNNADTRHNYTSSTTNTPTT